MTYDNQVDVLGNVNSSCLKASIIATNYIFVATYTHQMQRMIFWMQQPHQLSQQSLHPRQRNFIVSIGMYYRYQLNIRGNKHISIATLNRYYRNAQLVVAIGIHKGNHHFHCGINTNLLQRLFQQTQPTCFGCHNIQISQPINTLVAIKPPIATKYMVLQKNLVL
jgi:hypothetical protein